MMRRFPVIGAGMIALAVGLAAGPAMADVKAGTDAWAQGDFRKAVEEWRGPAVAGDPDAQFNLAQAYKLGRGVPLDPALAESWFRKAAIQGHIPASDNYGLALFQAGKKAEAAPWLEKSVARGEPRAQLVLGTMLFNGDGVPRDYPRAYALMTLASQAGLKAASETLAQMDQYITPADRERGTALAQRYRDELRNAPPAAQRNTAVATTSVPPSRTVETLRPAKTPPRKPEDVIPPHQRSPDRPVNDRIAPHEPIRKAPAAAAAPAPAPMGGSWKIQLGAFSTQANASTQWSRVRGKLGGAQPVYTKAGNVIRLQASGFANKAAAQKACAASGVSCVVVAP